MSDAIDREKQDPSNPALAAVAEAALRDVNFTRRGSECQRFIRQIIQARYGGAFDKYHDASAELSRRRWAKSPYAVPPGNGSVVGDILYKRGTKANPYGHVGIRVPGNKVAENSTTSKGRIQGAKGYRSLEDFGTVDLIVRLPRKR